MTIRLDFPKYNLAIRSDGVQGFSLGKPYVVPKTGQEILQQSKHYPDISSALRSVVQILAHVSTPDVTSIPQYIERIDSIWREIRDATDGKVDELLQQTSTPAVSLTTPSLSPTPFDIPPVQRRNTKDPKTIRAKVSKKPSTPTPFLLLTNILE